MLVEEKVGKSLGYQGRAIYVGEDFINKLNKFFGHDDLHTSLFATKGETRGEILEILIIGEGGCIHVYVYTHGLTDCQ